MNSLKLLIAVFAAIPFFVIGCYWVPFNIMTNVFIVILSAGIIAMPVMVIGFIVSTVLGSFGGGVRRR